MTPLVLALAGTDHHPFDRMVRWIDAAAESRRDLHFVVQYGTSTPPLVAEGHAYLAHERMLELIDAAAVIVCHGGPGTITDAREAGHIPLCVPRDPDLGEHVDGHQLRFAEMVGGAGVVRDVRSFETFQRELVEALERTPVGHEPSPEMCEARDEARARVAHELDDMIVDARPHLLGRRRHVG